MFCRRCGTNLYAATTCPNCNWTSKAAGIQPAPAPAPTTASASRKGTAILVVILCVLIALVLLVGGAVVYLYFTTGSKGDTEEQINEKEFLPVAEAFAEAKLDFAMTDIIELYHPDFAEASGWLEKDFQKDMKSASSDCKKQLKSVEKKYGDMEFSYDIEDTAPLDDATYEKLCKAYEKHDLEITAAREVTLSLIVQTEDDDRAVEDEITVVRIEDEWYLATGDWNFGEELLLY